MQTKELRWTDLTHISRRFPCRANKGIRYSIMVQPYRKCLVWVIKIPTWIRRRYLQYSTLLHLNIRGTEVAQFQNRMRTNDPSYSNVQLRHLDNLRKRRQAGGIRIWNAFSGWFSVRPDFNSHTSNTRHCHVYCRKLSSPLVMCMLIDRKSGELTGKLPAMKIDSR